MENVIREEFRGVDNLVYAIVEKDNNETGTDEGYKTGTVSLLAPVAEIAKTTAVASDAKYYDNAAMSVVNAEGADTVTLTVTPLALKTLAEVLGKQYDATTGAYLDGEAKPVYLAVGYRLRLTDGTYRYVWRYKCSIAIPDEGSTTANAGTDTKNQQLTCTGIMTNHKFTKGGSQKALVVDERDELADLSKFFDEVTTCDTLKAKTQTPA